MAYVITKVINGIPYLYEQRSWREGGKVRTSCRCIGRADAGGTAQSSGDFNTTPAGPAAYVPSKRKISAARAMLARIERDEPEKFARLRAAYEPAHKAANATLYRYIGSADDGRAGIWRLSAKVFGYYNRHGDAARAGIASFGDRRDWRNECAADLAAVRGPERLAGAEKGAKSGIRAAKAALTKAEKRRTWGRYRRQTIAHAKAQVRLQELRLERLRIVGGIFG